MSTMTISEINLNQVENIEFQNIDHSDYPDFSDAYISYAELNGVPLTDEQLDDLNENSNFVYEKVMERLF